MTRDELEHAIRAACDVARDTEVWVFGSQAILGQYPDAPDALRRSIEVDLTPKNHPEMTDRVDGALGQDSPFHATFGFYVHGVPIHEAATLPGDWEDRAIAVRNANTRWHTGWCLEAHDLAASKLVAFRDKDREFVRTLLGERLIGAAALRARIDALPVDREVKERLSTWVESVGRR